VSLSGDVTVVAAVANGAAGCPLVGGSVDTA